ncbi:cellulose binding domain-containing protein [Micromonospora sp. NPDC006766]|uniref:cellulose binding domain-containing protein n=1 Tax=Micromonospora sp. NPDC006766 TaxID=3154778 RepID=UPI0034010986
MSGTRRARPSSGATIISSPWIVVSIGVIVMVVLLVVALGSARGRRTYAEAPSEPAMPLPGLPAVATSSPPSSAAAPVSSPRLPPRPTVPPIRSTPSPSASAATASRSPSLAPSASPTSPPALLIEPPPSSPVTGRYGVVSTFHGGFIGEVLLVNTGDTPSGWTVTLSFSRGRLASSWLEGAEQGTASFAGGVFTYRSGVDLAPRASVRLRFHFERTGTTRPTRCTVDAEGCSGL